ncbi:hypothetical protein D3C84_1099540 [compost metagenome]
MQTISLHHLERLTQISHERDKIFEVRDPTLSHSALVFTGVRPLAVNVVSFDQAFQLGNRGAIKPQQSLFEIRIRMFQRHLVRKVYDEAGVTA